MINLAEVVDDPDLATTFIVVRATGMFSTTGLTAGEWVPTHTAGIDCVGVVNPNPKPDALLALPEGLRGKQAIQVFTRTRLYLGDGENESGDTTDYIQWNGELWKVALLKNWSDFGFWQAIATQSGRSDIGEQVP